MSEHWFLWPQARFFRGGLGTLSSSRPAVLEELLTMRYEGRGYPVVVSSGRIGLVLALEALGVRRADLIRLFPFASHCVIESVGRVGSPISGDATTLSPYRIVYHQWGYVQERSLSGKIIEDAVDTFCLPGAPLFPSGGEFEVWSLSKLLGSLGGGVIWCRDQVVASDIRQRRDERSALTSARWVIRLLSRRWPNLAPFWYGSESKGGAPPSWGCGDILHGLRHWDEIADARRERLEVMRQLLPSWLILNETRLPTVVPVAVKAEQGEALLALGFSTGFRHFERVTQEGAREVVKLFPIPIHQDVPLGVLCEARRLVLQ